MTTVKGGYEPDGREASVLSDLAEALYNKMEHLDPDLEEREFSDLSEAEREFYRASITDLVKRHSGLLVDAIDAVKAARR